MCHAVRWHNGGGRSRRPPPLCQRIVWLDAGEVSALRGLPPSQRASKNLQLDDFARLPRLGVLRDASRGLPAASEAASKPLVISWQLWEVEAPSIAAGSPDIGLRLDGGLQITGLTDSFENQVIVQYVHVKLSNDYGQIE